MKAKKWNFKEKKYYDYELPKGSVLSVVDMDEVITCASCGKKLIFGNAYTSKQIHSNGGFGYSVCNQCYKKELELEINGKQFWNK